MTQSVMDIIIQKTAEKNLSPSETTSYAILVNFEPVKPY